MSVQARDQSKVMEKRRMLNNEKGMIKSRQLKWEMLADKSFGVKNGERTILKRTDVLP